MKNRKWLIIVAGIALSGLLYVSFGLLVYLQPILQLTLEETFPVSAAAHHVGGLLYHEDFSEPRKIAITDVNRDVFVESFECIVEDGFLKAKGSLIGIPESDNEQLYLLHYPLWENDPDYESSVLVSDKKTRVFCLETEIDDNDADSVLYDRFQIAVLKEGDIFPIGNVVYICNPAGYADYQASFPKADSKKGLLIDPMHLSSEWENPLGLKHAIYNIPLSLIMGESPNPDLPTVWYEYHGKEYPMNGAYLAMYDYVFGLFAKNDIVTTAVVLLDKTPQTECLIHPNARGGEGYYYMCNTSDEESCETLEAVLTFLADRYRDDEHGYIHNWIIGNEVNVRKWNYFDYTDLDTYTKAYCDEFRIAYTAIRSRNANARVYISLDQQWDKDLEDDKSFYDAKDLLDTFARTMREEGDIYWGLAFHPYSVPLTWPKFWELSAKSEDLVRKQMGTPMISMLNIGVLTNYMKLSRMREPDGDVRHILLSEQGFPATQGESVQAAAIAYAYYIADENEYIDALLLSRETDAASEVKQGLSLGLYDGSGNRRISYEVFKDMDDEDGRKDTEFLLPTLGAKSWEDALSWAE